LGAFCSAISDSGVFSIQRLPHLSGLIPNPLIEELLRKHTRVTYSKGAIIFLEGSPADVTFYVLNGLIRLHCPRGDGNRIFIRLAGPGDFIGHFDFMNSEGRRTQIFEAQAFTRCTIALLTREHLRQLAEKADSATLVRVLEQINTAWSSVAHWYATFLGLSFRGRLEAVLRDLGTRLGAKEKAGVLLCPELSQSDLAEMIQSSRPMVSRLISQMTDEGILGRRGRHYILIGGSLVDSNCQSDPLLNGQGPLPFAGL
jgi:CRP/FNR family cyclic AMP-dependent transcriptional regulator